MNRISRNNIKQIEREIRKPKAVYVAGRKKAWFTIMDSYKNCNRLKTEFTSSVNLVF